MKVVDENFVEGLIAEAMESPRRRAHRNLHPSPDDPVQRFFMAAFPGSYCRPHRHRQRGRWELFTALGGEAAVLTFDDGGSVTGRHTIRGDGPARAVEVPPRTWHTVVIVAARTVLLEVKPGPYDRAGDKEFASWAPAEGTAGAGPYEKMIRRCAVGDRCAADGP